MNLYVFGAKNPETGRQIEACRAEDPSITLAGFLDNDPARHGTAFLGCPVLGGLEAVDRIVADDPEARFVSVITGSAVDRFEVSRALVVKGARLTNLIHPSVDLSGVAELGVGNYIQAGVLLEAGVRIGNNTSISTGSIVAHETIIGHSSFLAPGVVVAGVVTVGDGVFLGVNATVAPRLSIGRWATVGAGAVVVRSVDDGATVAGNPARVLREGEVHNPHGDVLG